MSDQDSQSELATERLREVRGVTWIWREDNLAGKSGHDMGVLAQEVEAVFPELVETDPSGYKKVNYAGLIGPLIEAVKELDARVKSLEKRSATRTDKEREDEQKQDEQTEADAESDSEDEGDEGDDKSEGRAMSDARLKRAVQPITDARARLTRIGG